MYLNNIYSLNIYEIQKNINGGEHLLSVTYISQLWFSKINYLKCCVVLYQKYLLVKEKRGFWERRKWRFWQNLRPSLQLQNVLQHENLLSCSISHHGNITFQRWWKYFQINTKQKLWHWNMRIAVIRHEQLASQEDIVYN